MKSYTSEELRTILENHKRWLYNQEGIKERADLSYADLSGAYLRYADLSSADLYGSNLCGADLRYADLSGADLYGSNLCGADLRYANLCGADLRYVDLSSADLRYADLRDADLSDADLSCSNLYGAIGNLRHVKSLQTEKYYITYTSKIIQIGCERHTIEELKNFNDKKILEMDGKEALLWWNKWKPIIMQIIELSPCEETKYEQ